MRSSARGAGPSQAVAIDQLEEALGADLRGRDLGLHVADDEVGARQLSRRICQTESLRRPSSSILIALNWRPSA